MEQFSSPDLPAWLCYLIVLTLGMLVARSTVNALLAAQPSRWGYLNTWALFGAHSAIPLGLFWFLDYTSALRDSALFSALVVAFGYRQIFAGGVQGITMPGQTPKLWQPFEMWVSAIKTKIVAEDLDSQNLFDTRVRTYLAATPQRLEKLRGVSFQYTQDPNALAALLGALDAKSAPSGAPSDSFSRWKDNEQVRILLNDLRKSQPSSYGFFLRENGILSIWMYRNWLQSARSRITGWIGTIFIAIAIIVGAWTCYQNRGISLTYYHWRLTKPGASNHERFRSHEYLAGRMAAEARATPQDPAQVSAIVSPLVTPLRYRDTKPPTADDILSLFVDAHSRAVDSIVVPQLIEALRNPNEDLRLRIRRALTGLQQADYPKTVPSDKADKWVPAKDESAVDIDGRVQEWQNWWKAAQAESSTPGSATAAPPVVK
jgi:hypothetical protein